MSSIARAAIDQYGLRRIRPASPVALERLGGQRMEPAPAG